MLRLFIACGARLDQRPGNGWATILIAAEAGNSEVIRILSEAGCVLDSAKGDDLAMAWISAKATVDVRRALATVDFVNRTPDSEAACIREVTSQSGHQGMMSMAHRGDITSLRAVIAAGADVEELLPEVQLTPVFGAAMSGNMETLVFLVEECGANVGHISAQGSVVIAIAAAIGNLDVFFYLVGKMPPALLDYADDHGTCHHCAATAAALLLLLLLLVLLLPLPHSPRLAGTTPLHVAASSGQTEIVLHLARLGCDIAHRDSNFMTPITLARSNNHHETARLLSDIESAGGWRMYVAARRMAYVRIRHEVSRTYKKLPKKKQLLKLRALYHFVFGRNLEGDEPMAVLPDALFREVCKWLVT